MFEPVVDPGPGPAAATTAAVILAFIDDLATMNAAVDDRAAVDTLEALERLKSAAAAAQARTTGGLESHRRDTQPVPGNRRARRARRVSDAGLGMEIGLARRESPHQGRRHLTLARALLTDLPCTLARLTRGDISEQAAQIITTETADLCAADRRSVDAELDAHLGGPDGLGGLGLHELQQTARRIALRLDETAAVRRRNLAAARRHVTSRVLPDGMAQITGYVTDLDHATIMGSLAAAAAAARAAGDERTRAQIQADLFTARLTGRATTAATGPGRPAPRSR